MVLSCFRIYHQLPHLTAGDIVVMDNVSFHSCAPPLVEDAEAFVVFTPTWSPEFNPIEQYFGALKNYLRHSLRGCLSVRRTPAYLKQCIYLAMMDVNDTMDHVGNMHSSGYRDKTDLNFYPLQSKLWDIIWS
jgi:hypothetical protein